MGAKNKCVRVVVAAQCWYVVSNVEVCWKCVKLCGVVICGGVQVPTTNGAAAPLLSTTQPAVEMLLRYSYINMWEGVVGGARARSTAPAPAAADEGWRPRERWPRRARAACGVVGEWWFA